jgi:hypothetical protein
MDYKKLILSKTKPEVEIDEEKILTKFRGGILLNEETSIAARVTGSFGRKALCLPPQFDYVLGVDEEGFKILVILKVE